MGLYGPFIASSAALGSTIALLMGNVLPSDGSKELESTNAWRYIFGAPLILSFIQLVAVFFVYKEETVKFAISKGNFEEAEKFIKKAYVYEGKDYTSKDVLEYLKKNSSKETSKIGLW